MIDPSDPATPDRTDLVTIYLIGGLLVTEVRGTGLAYWIDMDGQVRDLVARKEARHAG